MAQIQKDQPGEREENGKKCKGLTPKEEEKMGLLVEKHVKVHASSLSDVCPGVHRIIESFRS